MHDKVKKIHKTGYWRVNIRPTSFNKNFIPSLNECLEIIKACKVYLRGWDYPHLGREETTFGEDWIESGCDLEPVLEYWRFYQSGQFIHHFICREDYEIPDGGRGDVVPWYTPQVSPSGHYLDIINLLYTLTEIFEFSARLASHQVLSSGAEILIKLVDTKDRQLIIRGPGRRLTEIYRSRLREISYSHSFNEQELLSSAAQLALNTTIYFLERFNCTTISRSILLEDQAKLLERR